MTREEREQAIKEWDDVIERARHCAAILPMQWLVFQGVSVSTYVSQVRKLQDAIRQMPVEEDMEPFTP